MFCCFPKCCKKKVNKSTSPLNNTVLHDYESLDNIFYDIINNIDNNSNKHTIINIQYEKDLDILNKQHKELERQCHNLELELNKKEDNNYYLKNNINTQNKTICNLKKSIEQLNNQLQLNTNTVKEMENFIKFNKEDYDILLSNNLKCRNKIGELENNVNIKNNIIKDFDIKKQQLIIENNHLCNKNNKLKHLNIILNEKNKNLSNDIINNISENEYLTEKNIRLKKRVSI